MAEQDQDDSSCDAQTLNHPEQQNRNQPQSSTPKIDKTDSFIYESTEANKLNKLPAKPLFANRKLAEDSINLSES